VPGNVFDNAFLYVAACDAIKLAQSSNTLAVNGILCKIAIYSRSCCNFGLPCMLQ
jgi:hypothetical protein